jgi:long-chain acyl-CoA synthetase
LLTGATGFVGGELLLRLLERTDRDVVTPVRAADGEAAQGRVDELLEVLGAERHASRVTAMAAELTAPGLGLSDADRADVVARVSTIVHSAASVRFDLPLDEARAVNVEGTRAVVELARACSGLERLVHVSTAYVAGEHRNTYEQTKAEAEALVRGSGLPFQVVRPSIVVGDRRTGWTTSFNVIYAPLRAFARGVLTTVPGDPSAPVDVVPVDHVADGMLALLDEPSGGTHLLVAGDRATTIGELAAAAARALGRPEPELAQGGASIDLGELAAYFNVDTHFEDPATEAVLARHGLEPPSLLEYLPQLITFAEEARWGRALPARRPPLAA